MHVRELRGKRVAVDASAWLYRSLYTASLELAFDFPTLAPLRFLQSLLDTLLHNGVLPVLVFDGASPPLKDAVAATRADRRRTLIAHGLALASSASATGAAGTGQASAASAAAAAAEAETALARSLRPTRLLSRAFQRLLSRAGVPWLVAPYEADAQIAALYHRGLVAAAVTEDSDLLAFGCARLLLKLNNSSNSSSGIGAGNAGFAAGVSGDGWGEWVDVSKGVLADLRVLAGITGHGFPRLTKEASALAIRLAVASTPASTAVTAADNDSDHNAVVLMTDNGDNADNDDSILQRQQRQSPQLLLSNVAAGLGLGSDCALPLSLTGISLTAAHSHSDVSSSSQRSADRAGGSGLMVQTRTAVLALLEWRRRHVWLQAHAPHLAYTPSLGHGHSPDPSRLSGHESDCGRALGPWVGSVGALTVALFYDSLEEWPHPDDDNTPEQDGTASNDGNITESRSANSWDVAKDPSHRRTDTAFHNDKNSSSTARSHSHTNSLLATVNSMSADFDFAQLAATAQTLLPLASATAAATAASIAAAAASKRGAGAKQRSASAATNTSKSSSSSSSASAGPSSGAADDVRGLSFVDGQPRFAARSLEVDAMSQANIGANGGVATGSAGAIRGADGVAVAEGVVAFIASIFGNNSESNGDASSDADDENDWSCLNVNTGAADDAAAFWFHRDDAAARAGLAVLLRQWRREWAAHVIAALTHAEAQAQPQSLLYPQSHALQKQAGDASGSASARDAALLARVRAVIATVTADAAAADASNCNDGDEGDDISTLSLLAQTGASGRGRRGASGASGSGLPTPALPDTVTIDFSTPVGDSSSPSTALVTPQTNAFALLMKRGANNSHSTDAASSKVSARKKGAIATATAIVDGDDGDDAVSMKPAAAKRGRKPKAAKGKETEADSAAVPASLSLPSSSSS